MAATATLRLADGRTLAYCEYGDPNGAPLMYFHGVPGSRLDPTSLDAQYRERGVRVLAPDRPGFGKSSYKRGRRLLDWPRDAAELADELGLSRFAVLGYSSGGPYAVACAHDLRERVTVAGVVAGVGPPETPDFRRGLGRTDRVTMTLATRARPLAIAYWRVARLLAMRRPEAYLGEFEKELSEPDRQVLAVPELRSAVIELSQEAMQPGVRGIVHDLAIQARSWGLQLPDVSIPVRLWHGDRDETVPVHHSEHIAGAVQDGELTLLPGQGHLVVGEFPGIVARLAATGSRAAESPSAQRSAR